MKTIGLEWFIWDGALDWAASGTDLGRVPEGLKFPFIVHTKDNVPDDRITAAARRFPGNYWLIANEPNVPTHDDLTPEAYADALAKYAGLIKTADPTAKLVGPNVLNWNSTCDGCGGYTQGDGWTEAMRNAYIAKYNAEPPLDAWSLHIYDLDWNRLPQGNAQKQIDSVAGMRDWMDSIDAIKGKPLWVTEVGLHWAFPGIDIKDGIASPVGDYDQAHVENYMKTVFGWLNDNAAQRNIERWFVWALWSQAEPYQTVWGGISLADGRGAGSQLTAQGRLYQQLAGVQ